MSRPPAVLLVGPVTRDRNRVAGGPVAERPGGSALYAAAALAGLGHPVTLVTKLAARDRRALLAPLEAAGVRVYAAAAHATTAFDNAYAADGARAQRVRRVAPPILPRDLAPALAGGVPAVQLGPLLREDLPAETVRAARAGSGWLALDVQGLVRRLAAGRVRRQGLADPELLGLADVLKADLAEAQAATGLARPRAAARRLARLGRGEAVVTLGAEGALIVQGKQVIHLPALPPPGAAGTGARDTTGCGDSFLAVYLSRRLQGDAPADAGALAVAAGARKAGQAEPLACPLAELRRMAEGAPAPSRSRGRRPT